ncbi:MAG: hypothetical protein GYA33_10045 [Thermogutta sp.]|nr:hypothetical protein [Thermogutta sp.]
MNAKALLDSLRSAGCELRVDGDRLLVRGDGLNDDLRSEIRRNKPELLALVAAESVLELARRLGFPRFELLRDNWTPSDEDGWKDFVRTAEPEDVRLAGEILRSRLVEAEHVPTSEELRGDRAGGRRLLHALWLAGYEIKLEPSENAVGYALIPVGTSHEGTNFPKLYAMFERYHDAAVQLLVETCQRLRIQPQKWHIEALKLWQRLTAEEPVAKTAPSVRRKSLR